MPDAIDELFYSRVRLIVVAELLQVEWVAFTDLQSASGATRGNLGSHLAKLVESGVINEDKRFVNGRPLTRYKLTKAGRAAFLRHIEHIEALFEAARKEYGEADLAPPGSAKPVPSPARARTPK